MNEVDFFKAVADLSARMDKLDEYFLEEKIKLFSIGIELEEIKGKLEYLDD